ncbi:2TM domain-containing protein [Brachybacterium subflavum]|jgi:hypothetical protein|uniref:2TM domain-containing protein n=1 Tax=Brachybacterium subflavum TaxID=2585206 RepID=UPI0012661CC0|nr:2TM domain-containing protein [Brachybacterium subflavum]
MHRYQDSFDAPAEGAGEADLRRRAIDRLHARRSLIMSLAVYVVVNGMLVVFWARNGGGFFWPFFPIAFWGIGLLWQVLGVFGRGVSEDRIQAEMHRLGGEGR